MIMLYAYDLSMYVRLQHFFILCKSYAMLPNSVLQSFVNRDCCSFYEK
jgi:hypothetical protein